MIISKSQINEIVRYAQDNLPDEICGIIAGKNTKVENIYKMVNAAETPETCYFMDAKEQFKVIKEIRAQGLELIGIYHSHPESPAYPSARDVELAFYPEASYIIISLQDKNNPVLKSYKIVDGKIEEEEVIEEEKHVNTHGEI